MTTKYRLDDLPIPPDAVAGGTGWTPLMMDMADCVGAYRALLICDYFGGVEMYVTHHALKNRFLPVIGLRSSEEFSRRFGGERIIVPLAGAAIARARRSPVVAAARAGLLTMGHAAEIVGMRRDNFSRVVNHSAEGIGVTPVELPIIKNIDMLRDAAAVAATALEHAGADTRTVDAVRDAIVQIGNIQADREALRDTAPALERLKEANDARTVADASGGSLLEAYKLMLIAARAGSTEAQSHLLDMAEEMSPWQCSIARSSLRIGGALGALPASEALRLSRERFGVAPGVIAPPAPRSRSLPNFQSPSA